MRQALKMALEMALAAALLCGVSGAAWAELAVIANPANPVAALSPEDIKLIYLGKRQEFPGGGAVKPVDQKEGSPVRDAFATKIVGKDASQLKAYWSKMIFSGRGTPPQEVGDDAAVKAWVVGNPEGLGYIDGGAVDATVKVLLVVP